ncbi:MAG: hypothetical protein R6W74_07120, partial [Nitrosomonas halophila]
QKSHYIMHLARYLNRMSPTDSADEPKKSRACFQTIFGNGNRIAQSQCTSTDWLLDYDGYSAGPLREAG